MDRLGNGPVPKNIEKFIEEKGLKKSFVASRAGMTPSELSAVLNGRRRIRVCEILYLSQALDVTPNELLAE